MNKKDLDVLKAFRKKYPIRIGDEVKPSPPHEKDDEHRVYRGGLMRSRYQPPEHEIVEHKILTFLEYGSGNDEFTKLLQEDAHALMEITARIRKARAENNLDDLEKYSHFLAMGCWNSFLFYNKDDDERLSKIEQEGILAKGRKAATALKEKKSGEKLKRIKTALDDLYKAGEGYKMTYEQIADFLIQRNISTYAESTTLKHVKKFSPEFKEKYK